MNEQDKTILLNEKQVEKKYGICRRTLQGWRYSGKGPQYIGISGRAVRYRVADIEAWLDSLKRYSTSQNCIGAQK